MNLSCVIYLRVSDEKQTRGASLSDQERTCREFAARAGYKVVAVYRDDGRSAWKDDLRHRPQFEQLLADAGQRGRRWCAVVVFKLDRFARKARIYHTSRYELERAGVQLLSATEPNESSAAGRLSSGMLAQFAEFYSDQLSERIRASHQGKAARGEWVGDVPFGYVRAGKSIVPGPLWLWVVCIFVAYSQGATTPQLAAALNAAHVPLRSGKPWTKDSVQMVLRNHAYVGRAGGRAVPAYESGHKPLVTSELWQAVQSRLYARRRRPSGPRKGPRPAPLPWRVRCALCDGSMHRHSSAGGRYLRCRAALNKTCSAKGIQLHLVEQQIAELEKAAGPVATVWLRAPRGVEKFVLVAESGEGRSDA
jgi:site-specific DNA recombinase